MGYKLIKNGDGTFRAEKVVTVKSDKTEACVKDVRDVKVFSPFKLYTGEQEIIKIENNHDIFDIPDRKEIPTIGPDLEEWRRINIPAWRRILKESQQTNDKGREEYARKMLIEVLEVNDK